LAIIFKPALQGREADLLPAVAGKVMLKLGLLTEVFVLGPLGLGQNGADDLVALEGDFLGSLVSWAFLLGRFW
jgi:hypothetical protein